MDNELGNWYLGDKVIYHSMPNGMVESINGWSNCIVSKRKNERLLEQKYLEDNKKRKHKSEELKLKEIFNKYKG